MKKFNEVIKILNNIKFSTDENFKENSRLELIAKSNDQIGNYHQAFDFFKQNNELAKKIDKNNANKDIFIDIIQRRINYFNNSSNDEWKIEKNEDNFTDPIFLIGFPRSGTTLLDTILRSHPKIDVLEEKPIVDKFIEKLHQKTLSKFENLNSPTSSLRNEMRKFYFEHKDILQNIQKTYGVGTDQTPLNFMLKRHNVERKLLPYEFNMSCMLKKEIFLFM